MQVVVRTAVDERDGVEVVEALQHLGHDRADLVLVEAALVHCTPKEWR